MWARSKNSEAKKPEKMERSGSQVIIRKDFLFVEETEDDTKETDEKKFPLQVKK